ncbi:uncharacterized protein C2orf80 homolog [Pyxicephalus adspersus]|uniref:uncharacterized protein C2orf80 homolog n=1 Tax=Pyxicephalus adspersus TaxID=30357 RepID=UPI003B5A52DE
MPNANHYQLLLQQATTAQEEHKSGFTNQVVCSGVHMERKRLRKELEKLLGDYVSTTLREKEFDPKGRRESSSLDDLAHYDLAVGVALQWLSSSSFNEAPKKDRIRLALSQPKYPNRMEREAMILSSFAGTLMHSLPVADDVFDLQLVG